MYFRVIAGIFAGIVLWWFLFIAVGIGFGLLWPAYREAARIMFSAGDFSHFTTPMLCLNFIVFLIAGLVVGWLVSFISKHRMSALAVALLYLLVMAFNHYITVWDKLPDWYNVIVPWIISGAIVLGSRFFRTALSASK